MTGDAPPANRTIANASRISLDAPFSDVVRQIPAGDDDALAEAIEKDGRQRLSQGLTVELTRYLAAINGLADRVDPLDAAIDVALRSLAGGSRITPQAVAMLIERHPELETAIHEASSLNQAVWSTTGLHRRMNPPPAKHVPFEFGPMLPTGQRRYVLQELLGQGAFGQVYRSLDRQLSEEGHTALVAIKIFVAADRTPWDRQRLIEEATKVRRINHPNVVQVLDRGVSEDDEDFIVYELVDGGDLSKRIGDNLQPWTPRDAALLVSKIAQGVHAAHSAGVIHCDLKPGNIMLTAAGEPKVADFGVAIRIGETRQSLHRPDDARAVERPIGNIAFISPEQFRGESDAVSVQADVYALGGILFYLLTGEFPNGSTLTQIAKSHDAAAKREAPSARSRRRHVDHDLDWITRHALAFDPSQRYPSAAALVDDLHRWVSHQPLSTSRRGPLHKVRLWIRRKPALAGAVLVALVIAVAGSMVIRHFAVMARQRRLDAAVAKARLEERQAFDAKWQQIRDKTTVALQQLRDVYRLNTEILPQIWVLEYVFGPTVLDLRDKRSQLWQDRIETLRWLVADARNAGRSDAMETLLWESALGFWLVGAGDFEEAEPLLTANVERWRQKLDDHDPWLSDLQGMITCAMANRLAAQAQSGTIDLSDTAELRQVEAALNRIDQEMPNDHRGTPLHYLVLDRLMSVYGPNLLNDPARVEQLKKTKAELQKSKL